MVCAFGPVVGNVSTLLTIHMHNTKIDDTERWRENEELTLDQQSTRFSLLDLLNESILLLSERVFVHESSVSENVGR